MDAPVRHLVVAGLGVTGSHLAPHLARMPEIERVTLVDPDAYSPENRTQNIEQSDLGKAKVEAVAERMLRIRPNLEVSPVAARIEDVPRGQLACGLFVSCLDTKIARQHLNSIAWQMGTTWLDCGVLGSQSLVRVSGYRPGDESACLECSWNAGPNGEYALLEQEYLCAAAGDRFPSMAPSALGGLAASLLAIEIAKLLRGEVADSIVGQQAIYNAQHHRLYVTRERKNPWCRFNHRTWNIQRWRCDLHSTSVGSALRERRSLGLEGQFFARELICPRCGKNESALRLNRPAARCPTCGGRLASGLSGPLERLHAGVAAEWMDRTLAQIGLRPGDIVTAGRNHYLLEETA